MERAPIRVYAGHFPVAAYQIFGIDAVTLTILRDPVDRTVSMLKHCKRDIDMFRDLDLDEIYERRFVRVAFVDNFQTKQFAFTPADAPESCLDKLEVDEGRLRIAIANLESVDVVGVTEHFDVFLDQMHRRFGWEFSDLGNPNVSREQWDVSPELRARDRGGQAARHRVLRTRQGPHRPLSVSVLRWRNPKSASPADASSSERALRSRCTRGTR